MFNPLTQAVFGENHPKKPSIRERELNVIIDLTVKNFRSLRDEQILSMNVESPKSHLLGNIATTENDKINILKTAGIYGANASGKSNLLLAFRALQWIADDSGDLKDGENIPCYEPYRLSKETLAQPISLEVEFLNDDDLRYVYCVTYNRKEIISESLDYYPSRQRANIFRRVEGDSWETISFGSHYKGGIKRIPFFKNNSYLAKAGNNAAASEIIKSVYQYFRRIFRSGLKRPLDASSFYDTSAILSHVAQLLSHIDTGILEVSRKEKKLDDFFASFPSSIPDDVRKELEKRNKYDFIFTRVSEEGDNVNFTLKNESDGTQKLFNFLPILCMAFAAGSVLIMDELDNSFHPHVAELIIKLFNDPKVNHGNAQLIFSTHNINLMSPQLMRRDQVWFTEKKNGASNLYSLDEFDKSTVKSSTPYSHWYDEGRFGALPQINYNEIAKLLSMESLHDTYFSDTEDDEEMIQAGEIDA